MADPARTTAHHQPPLSDGPEIKKPAPRPTYHDPEAHPKSAAPDPTGRRKFVRTNIELDVELRIEGESHAATTENLSPGGVFVRCAHVIQVGETLDLLIKMPNESQITAHGVVRWVRYEDLDPHGSGMGVQFLQLEGGSMLGY